ncbi:MAG: TolC family protein [Pseudomonadota bacterium]
MWRIVIACLGLAAVLTSGAQALTLREAVRNTIMTNPSIGASSADSRASFYQLQQARGRYLPTIDVELFAGPTRLDRPAGLSDDINRQWYASREAAFRGRQVLFDGFNRANDLYRAAAVIDAAALRVLETSEAQALNAVETYIDVRRHGRLLRISDRNVQRHQELLTLIRTRFDGGKAPQSSVDQSVERLEAAKAVREEIRNAFLAAKARFKAVIGLEATTTHAVGLPPGMPRTRKIAVDAGLSDNPTLQAADADVDAALFEKRQARSSYLPTVAVEGDAIFGRDISGTLERNHELSARVVLSWNLFDGFIKTNRQRELTERVGQRELERDVEARDLVEAIERAWAAYVTGGTRVAALSEQERIARKVRISYLEEYELDKRSLLDLLDSEASLFSARFSLESARAVRIFAAYQLIGSMGRLLETIGVEAPEEAIGGYRQEVRDNRGIFNVVIEPLRKP